MDEQRFYVARSVPDAVAALADNGEAGAVLAGATWIMRAPIRQERHAQSYIAISKIDELRTLEILDREIRIGACVTHAELAAALSPLPDVRALAQAAIKSANPAVRQVATVGGNLSAWKFAAADLVPALICLQAEIDLETPRGSERMTLERFIELRAGMRPGYVLRRVVVPRTTGRSAHIRLPLRKAGDYPVAIVSMATTLSSNGTVTGASVAVGSVEMAARRWKRLEADLIGRAIDPAHAGEMAEKYSGDFQGRDGVEAPGWYRVKVLKSLVHRAAQEIQQNS
jgi:carbon-monoxide dehydrogenase medium subunit